MASRLPLPASLLICAAWLITTGCSTPDPAAALTPGERAVQAASPDGASGGLGALLEPIRKRHKLPALAAAVIVDGKTAATGAMGARKAGDPTRVTADDQFHLGSDTKAMTATLIGKLVERGKLSWDTPLEKALPDLAGEMQPEWHSVTLLQVLQGRGGFPEETAPPGKSMLDLHQLLGTHREQRTAYLRMILKQKPAAPPGTKFIYSNAGYVAAGAIAERVLDAPWEALMQREIFQPLGMASAGYGSPGTPGKVNQPWQHLFENGRSQPIGPGPLSDNPPLLGPAGTVHCSVGDWAKFAAAHLQGEQGQDGLLKAATIRKLHTPPAGGDYACGWVTAEREWGGGRVLNHAGSNTLSYCTAWLAPKRNFAVLICTNQGNDAASQACDDAAVAVIQRYLAK